MTMLYKLMVNKLKILKINKQIYLNIYKIMLFLAKIKNSKIKKADLIMKLLKFQK